MPVTHLCVVVNICPELLPANRAEPAAQSAGLISGLRALPHRSRDTLSGARLGPSGPFSSSLLSREPRIRIEAIRHIGQMCSLRPDSRPGEL
jgi:hypothetical protein